MKNNPTHSRENKRGRVQKGAHTSGNETHRGFMLDSINDLVARHASTRFGWEADFEYPIRRGCEVLFVSLNRTKNADAQGVVYGHNRAFWNKLWLGGLLTKKVSHPQNGMKEVFGTRTEKGEFAIGDFCFVDLLDRLDTDSRMINVSKWDIEALHRYIKHIEPKATCIMHSKPWNIIATYFSNALDNTGYGRKGLFCQRPIFRVPAPEGSNITDIVQKQAYGEIQQFIYSLKGVVQN